MAVDLEWLLRKLCVDLGFCLPPQEQQRLLNLTFNDADVLTREVLISEGVDPQYCDRQLYSTILERVQRYCFPHPEPDMADLQRRLERSQGNVAEPWRLATPEEVPCAPCPPVAWGKRLMNLEPGAMTLSEEDRRLIALWAADCAERVLPLFEAQAPSDTRPRLAIEGIRAFALGGKRTGHLRSLAWAAHAAAREVGDPLASAPLGPRPTQRRPRTCTHWRPLTS
jgi:hypothetical protein